MSDFRKFNNSRGDNNRGGFGRRDYGRRNFGDNRDSSRRTMYQATCAECGNKCEIPFEPKDGRSVYCSNCFEKRGNSNSNSRRFERNNTSNNNDSSKFEVKEMLDRINSKIDKLLNLLTPEADNEKADEKEELEMEKLEEEPAKAAKKSVAKKKIRP